MKWRMSQFLGRWWRVDKVSVFDVSLHRRDADVGASRHHSSDERTRAFGDVFRVVETNNFPLS
jgi:hypothetical protein